MDIDLFTYEYPDALVAQKPLAERHASRMMVVERATKTTNHSKVLSLPAFLRRGDLVVVNDSRVAAARIFGTRASGEGIEILVVESAGESLWRCLLKRPWKMKPGEEISFGNNSNGIVRNRDNIYLLVEFPGDSLELAVKDRGVPPLPPYIKRQGYDAYTAEDRERYQTVYAKHSGSAAAPTAGLHLSQQLIDSIEALGAETAAVTLHVGIDTFAPVREKDVQDHRMHGETVEILEETAHRIAIAKAEGRRVIAVGTTTARALESASSMEIEESKGFISWKDGRIHHGTWTTRLYILPGYNFRAVDALLTNFHQPRSTLLAMICAFADRDLILASYEEAIKEQYRLFSYGDCMLIL